MKRNIKSRNRTGAAVFALVFALSVSACDHTPIVISPPDPNGAEFQAEFRVASAIALFECGYSAFGTMALGAEGVMESVAGVAPGTHIYDHTPDTGPCDSSSANDSWFDQIMGARALISDAPTRLAPTSQGDGRGVYDMLQDEATWADFAASATGERVSAIGAIYMAASLDHFGEFLCETALDRSDILSPSDVLGLAEEWITNRALVHIAAAGGDFEMPFGIASSAEDMAIGLRARIRWANGNLAGAAADASSIDDGFTAWVTRDLGQTRRNKIFHHATEVGFSAMLGVNDWWNSAIRRPNPATGLQWEDPIPFTGYLFLGIMPDGRTLEVGNLPVRWAEEVRDANWDPVPLANGAVSDSRVTHMYKAVSGPKLREVPTRYNSEADDIPLVSWEEMRLIEADYAHATGDLAAAIDLVNVLRADKLLPEVTGVYRTSLEADADEVRYLVLEERRREFYAEGGRYWSSEIQNTDLAWFPRAEGETPYQGYALQGAVRQQFVESEYEENPYFIAAGGLAARGTGCDPAEAPAIP